MTTGTGSAGGLECRNLTGSKRHRRIAAIARRSTSWRTPRSRHTAVTSPRSSMRISTIAHPWRPATSSPDRSGAASPIFLGTSASQPTRQARGASMWHGGGWCLVIGGSAGSRTGSEHPLPSANTSHMPRQAFGPTWYWTPNGGDWPQSGQCVGGSGPATRAKRVHRSSVVGQRKSVHCLPPWRPASSRGLSSRQSGPARRSSAFEPCPQRTPTAPRPLARAASISTALSPIMVDVGRTVPWSRSARS
jgi:hypothetical protein